MKVIGLTGGIASGKTTIAQYLEDLGAVVIYADLLAREVTKPGTLAWQEIVDFFGPQIIQSDGQIHRAALGERVFTDAHALHKLNQITHPRVKKEIQQILWKQEKTNSESIVVLEVPLLIEAGFTSLVEEIWLVTLSEEEQISRLQARNGLSKTEAQARIANQMPLAEKLPWADRLIDNQGNLEQTRHQVEKLWFDLTSGKD